MFSVSDPRVDQCNGVGIQCLVHGTYDNASQIGYNIHMNSKSALDHLTTLSTNPSLVMDFPSDMVMNLQ